MSKNIDIIIKNCIIYTQNENRDVFHNAVIAIDNEEIIFIKENITDADIDSLYTAKETIDASGQVIFPGMINTHMHMFQSLFKGLGADLGLMDWIKAVPAPFGVKINHKLQELACKLAVAESIKSGCTTVSEFFYTQHDPSLAHTAIKTMQSLGIRHIFIRTFHDCGTEMGVPDEYIEDIDTALKNTDILVDTYKDDPLTTIWHGPCVSWATTEEAYKKTAAYSLEKNIPYSMHTLETLDDNDKSIEKTGMKLIPYLESVGFLTPNFLAVHCVNLAEDEIDTFKKYDVKINHNPLANMYLGSGIAPIAGMIQKGLKVSVGTDGAASNNTSDLIETLKTGSLLQKAANRDAGIISAQNMLDMATCEGAECVHMKEEIGSLEVGKKADLFIFNSRQLKSYPMHNPLSTLVYSASDANVETTIVNGKILYSNGVFLNGLNEEKLFNEIDEHLNILMESMNNSLSN